MEVRASLNQIRLAPRKVRAVVGVIRKKDALRALDQLAHTVKRPAPVVMKLLQSAIANAENGYQMVPSNLFIKEVVVNEGTKLKRYSPRAQGRATEVQKKTSHITIVLDEKVAGLKQEVKRAAPAPTSAPATESGTAKTEGVSRGEAKPEVKTELGRKKGGFFGGLTKRFTRRKAI